MSSLLFRNRFRHHSNFQCSNLTRKNWSVLAFLRKSAKHTSVQRAICKYFLEIDISGSHYLKNLPLLLIFSWCVIYHILYIILRFAYFLRRLRLHLHLHLEENKRRDDTVSVTYNFRKTSGNAAIIMSNQSIIVDYRWRLREWKPGSLHLVQTRFLTITKGLSNTNFAGILWHSY